jgi:hypothetical protein
MRLYPLALVVVAGCGGATALYPPRPPAVPGLPLAEPAPSRVVVHTTVAAAAMTRALEDAIPASGAGTFTLLGGEKRYLWNRKPLELAFGQGRITVGVHVVAHVQLLGTVLDAPLDLKISAEPVLSADYRARLQSPEVQVTSKDATLRLAQSVGGALDKIKEQIDEQLKAFTYDLRPMLDEAHGRLARPIDLPLGDAHGCAELRVLGVEAGPTVLADGVEKDLALVVAPSVTLPCAAPPTPAPLPPLANVTTLQPGPFTVSVPIAARYDELARAMSLAFTDGKLYFSKEVPSLYMEKPEVYATRDQLVLKLHINGRIDKYGIHTSLDGDLFMAGHPTVIDNEIRIPDLEPTIETSSFLLKLKAAIDGDSIRDQARQALRLDIGERLASVRNKLSSELSFGNGQGCVRANVSKIEVSGVYPHANYLRLYVGITAQASVFLPCPPQPVAAK